MGFQMIKPPDCILLTTWTGFNMANVKNRSEQTILLSSGTKVQSSYY